MLGPLEPLVFTNITIDATVAGMAISSNDTAYSWYRDGTVTYDGAFIARPYGQSTFSAPVAYAAGTNADPSSSNTSSGLTHNADHCQQQGGAERDPEGWRVWRMHSYGLDGPGLSMRARWAG